MTCNHTLVVCVYMYVTYSIMYSYRTFMFACFACVHSSNRGGNQRKNQRKRSWQTAAGGDSDSRPQQQHTPQQGKQQQRGQGQPQQQRQGQQNANNNNNNAAPAQKGSFNKWNKNKKQR